MKIIKYKFLSCQINHGTEENPEYEDVLVDKEICCAEAYMESNLEAAKKEAYKGEYTVDDDGQPEPEIPTEDSVWDELDEAYQRGVDSV